MIIGIGIDTVDVQRFCNWHTYSRKNLSRIFTYDEIEYCLRSNPAQRFAVRFAAREAFFKALSYAYPQHTIPFFAICRYSMIEKKQGRPIFIFNWDCIAQLIEDNKLPRVHVSFTHTTQQATAFVIIEYV